MTISSTVLTGSADCEGGSWLELVELNVPIEADLEIPALSSSCSLESCSSLLFFPSESLLVKADTPPSLELRGKPFEFKELLEFDGISLLRRLE